MNWVFGVLWVMLAFYIYTTQTTLSHLRDRNIRLTQDLSLALGANEGFKQSIDTLNLNYTQGIKSLENIKREKQKEVHYVTTVKEQIKVDSNAKCLDAINAIYLRMHELTQPNTSSDSTTTEKQSERSSSGSTSDRLEKTSTK